MPKMRGLLPSRPKIDEAEAALAQSRLSARLADLFGTGAATALNEDPSSADDPAVVAEEPVFSGADRGPWELSEPGSWLGPRRPPIVVEGVDDGLVDDAEKDEVDLVGVMARSGDAVG